MLYLVEVRLYGDDLAASMNSARTCIDHHNLKPKMFRVTLAVRGAAIVGHWSGGIGPLGVAA
jgi:hypothetical protein